MKILNNILSEIGIDKILHFLVCFSLILALSKFIGLYSIIPVAVLSIIKEVLDHFDENNYFSVLDLIADFAGIVFGILIYIL